MLELLHTTAEQAGYPKPKVLLGIIPPRSAQAARRMNQEIVGVNIPEAFIEMLERSSQPTVDSIRFCADIVHELKPLADGFHFMPVGMASKIGLLLDECFAVSSS
jgi:methylenetetrahydrofolate reductase (NADPH)